MSRRSFLEHAAIQGLILSAPTPASAGQRGKAWQEAISSTWRAANPAARGDLDVRELVRLATLAASSHNTQPWKFRMDTAGVAILPDFTRRCPIVDPDDSHLFKSLGCAAENLVHAAAAQGYDTELRFDLGIGGVVASFERSSAATPSELYGAIAKRQCTRSEYDGQAAPLDQLALLERIGEGSGVRTLLVTDSVRRETLLEYVAEGNRRQIADANFVRELVRWIRFSEAEALETRDGLFTGASGNPVVPGWIGRLAIRLALTPESQNDKDARGIRSSAGIAAFVAKSDDRTAWVEAGRAYERFALQSTALGMRHAFINQPIEVRSLRPQLAALLGAPSEHVHLLVRFGYAPEMPRSLRRPVEEVLA